MPALAVALALVLKGLFCMFILRSHELVSWRGKRASHSSVLTKRDSDDTALKLSFSAAHCCVQMCLPHVASERSPYASDEVLRVHEDGWVVQVPAQSLLVSAKASAEVRRFYALMLQTVGVVSAPTLNGKEDGLNGKDLDGHAEDGHAEQQKPARAEVSHGDEGLAESVAKKVEQAEPVSVEACAYRGAPVPNNEKERHETLCACNILDSSPDPRFDDITKLVRLWWHACVFCVWCKRSHPCSMAMLGSVRRKNTVLVPDCRYLLL